MAAFVLKSYLKILYLAYLHRLTAFVLKSYAQARPWIDIDNKEIKQTSDWLLKSQSKDGCFPSLGSLHNKAMKGLFRFILKEITNF